MAVRSSVALEVIDISSIAAGEGGVWITSGQELFVLDPASAQLRESVHLDDPVGAIQVGRGRVWALEGPPHAGTLRSAVIAVDPSTLTITLRTASQPKGLAAIVVGMEGVWASDPATGRLIMFEFDSGMVGAEVAVDSWQYEGSLASGFGRIWIVDRTNGIISAVDERTRRQRKVDVDLALGAVAVGRDAVWLTNDVDGAALRVPADRGEPNVVELTPGVAALAVGEGAVWVVNPQDRSLVRIDEETLDVRSIELPASPMDIAVGDGSVWVLYSGPSLGDPGFQTVL